MLGNNKKTNQIICVGCGREFPKGKGSEVDPDFCSIRCYNINEGF
jgi:endogenous inhibitor of DNA gyrase (YacG/DUF329 family)